MNECSCVFAAGDDSQNGDRQRQDTHLELTEEVREYANVCVRVRTCTHTNMQFGGAQNDLHQV